VKKILITGGCSFSDPSPWNNEDTWPMHLERLMPEYDVYHTGAGSHGNAIISRRIIYTVNKCIEQGIDTKDILVGVMWSGPNRWDIWSDKNPPGYIPLTKEMDMRENPTTVVDTDTKNWYVFGYWNKLKFNEIWYSYYQSYVMDQISTIEHILRTQWLLKNLNINYFMSYYMNEVFPPDLCNHPEIRHLYNMIDFEQFLPVGGEYEWCRDYSSFDFPDPDDKHPGKEQHKDFVDSVIWPWLVSKKIIEEN